MMEDKSTPFWLSRKFWYAVLATVAFVVLAVTQTVEFSSDQVMVFILSLLGVTTGLHAATDIGSQIASALVARGAQMPTNGDKPAVSASDDTDSEENPDEA